MKSSSIWKQTIRIVRLSLATLLCVATLSFGTTEPSFAANYRVLPTLSPVAIFGLGREVEGKAEQLQGRAQVITNNKKVEGMAKQIKGRAKYDIGRVEDVANRKAAQVRGMVRDMK
jgi:uncharacterized protein YjbJ (UPF0337 family)